MSLDKAKEALAAKTGTEIEPVKKKVSVPSTMEGLKTSNVKEVLALYTDQIAQAVPHHLTADRVIQLATTLITRNKDIAACTTESLIGAVMQASILGFEPIAALGQCYFVPYNNKGKKEIQFIIGYKGMIDLARRSGEILNIQAYAVYSNDKFEYCFGLNPDVVHVPAKGERGKFEYAYAVCKFLNGGYAFEVMSKDDINKIRQRSKAGASNFSPWHTDYDEMAKKTVIRRLFKILPISITKTSITDETIVKPEMFADGEIDTSMIEEVEYSTIEEQADEPNPEKEIPFSAYPETKETMF